jgi:hypothetical protein
VGSKPPLVIPFDTERQRPEHSFRLGGQDTSAQEAVLSMDEVRVWRCGAATLCGGGIGGYGLRGAGAVAARTDDELYFNQHRQFYATSNIMSLKSVDPLAPATLAAYWGFEVVSENVKVARVCAAAVVCQEGWLMRAPAAHRTCGTT